MRLNDSLICGEGNIKTVRPNRSLGCRTPVDLVTLPRYELDISPEIVARQWTNDSLKATFKNGFEWTTLK